MLKSLGAAMAASGAVALYHVNEITMETRFPFFKKHIEEDEREVVEIEFPKSRSCSAVWKRMS